MNGFTNSLTSCQATMINQWSSEKGLVPNQSRCENPFSQRDESHVVVFQRSNITELFETNMIDGDALQKSITT